MGGQIGEGSEQSGSRTMAEENFKAAFGEYPQRVDLPEPEPDAAMDRWVYWFLTGRDDYRPNLRAVSLSYSLIRRSAGEYATRDGRYEVTYEEWWLEGECECLMCQQDSPCPNGGAGKRSGWTVFDTVTGNHVSGEPFEFESFRDARHYLAHHLEAAGCRLTRRRGI